MHRFTVIILVCAGCGSARQTATVQSVPPAPAPAAVLTQAAPLSDQASVPPAADEPPTRDVGQVGPEHQESAGLMLELVDGFVGAAKAGDFRKLAPYFLTRAEFDEVYTTKATDDQWLDYLAGLHSSFDYLLQADAGERPLDWSKIRYVGAYASEMTVRRPNIYVIVRHGEDYLSIKLDDCARTKRGWRIADGIASAQKSYRDNPSDGTPWLKQPATHTK